MRVRAVACARAGINVCVWARGSLARVLGCLDSNASRMLGALACAAIVAELHAMARSVYT